MRTLLFNTKIEQQQVIDLLMKKGYSIEYRTVISKLGAFQYFVYIKG